MTTNQTTAKRRPGRPRTTPEQMLGRLSGRNAELVALMAQHQLTRADVARLLGLPVEKYTHPTVKSWLVGRRNIPQAKLELLRVKLMRSKSDPPGCCGDTMKATAPKRRPGRPRKAPDDMLAQLSGRNAELHALMTHHQLTRADVARLLDLPVDNYTHPTVQSWLAGRRQITAAKLELLRLKLQMRGKSDPQ